MYLSNVSAIAGLHQSSFPPSLPASLISSCRAPYFSRPASCATSPDRTGPTVSSNSFSITSSLSLYESIPEYFRQHMEPPEATLQPKLSVDDPTNEALSPPPAGISGGHRTLRSASAGRNPDKANCLLDEFAAEELRTLSTLLPPSATRPPGVMPGGQPSSRAASPHSPTVSSQPAESEQFSPDSERRADRSGVKCRNRKCCQILYVCMYVCCLLCLGPTEGQHKKFCPCKTI